MGARGQRLLGVPRRVAFAAIHDVSERERGSIEMEGPEREGDSPF